ncbi:hypothetical protein NDU88_004454 [Pleurodeles waltl]|uniref:Secreted protein n=1 Tax=Pleurodeles waltl TaxID=8319 RepID=A0AAV7T877_PLEWA|nr:hypothetical protein NDU88_004454 [Pleurodeles waltl]
MRLKRRFVFLPVGLVTAPFFRLILHEALDWASGLGEFRDPDEDQNREDQDHDNWGHDQEFNADQDLNDQKQEEQKDQYRTRKRTSIIRRARRHIRRRGGLTLKVGGGKEEEGREDQDPKDQCLKVGDQVLHELEQD